MWPIAEIGAGKVSGEGSSGTVAEVGRIAVKKGFAEENKVAALQGHAAFGVEVSSFGDEGDRSHFRSEIGERNPSRHH